MSFQNSYAAWVTRNRLRPEWQKWCVLCVGVVFVMTLLVEFT